MGHQGKSGWGLWDSEQHAVCHFPGPACCIQLAEEGDRPPSSAARAAESEYAPVRFHGAVCSRKEEVVGVTMAAIDTVEEGVVDTEPHSREEPRELVWPEPNEGTSWEATPRPS